MPARSTAASGGKRKRTSEVKEKPVKRARSVSVSDIESDDDSDGDSENDPRAEILLLQNRIIESRKHYNDISKLIEIVKAFEDDADSAALASVALTKVFMTMLSGGSLVKRKGLPEKDTVVVQWLRDRYFEFKTVLLGLVKDEELGLPALTLALKVLKSEGQHLQDSDEHSFPQVFLQQIMQALLDSGSDDARSEFVDNFLTEFDDIRFYALKAIK